MACNKYQPHLFVLPEDDANRQIVNGFLLHPSVRETAIQVLPVAGGWCKALQSLDTHHLSDLYRYQARRLLLVIDFDQDFDARRRHFFELIPAALQERAFLLGALTEPEHLRTSLRQDYEEIGHGLGKDCADNQWVLWDHQLLKQNRQELERLVIHVKPFVFGENQN